jgi:hypothetical protein
MPRRPRINPAGYPQHVVQCGHNREACFFADEDSRLLNDRNVLPILAIYSKPQSTTVLPLKQHHVSSSYRPAGEQINDFKYCIN